MAIKDATLLDQANGLKTDRIYLRDSLVTLFAEFLNEEAANGTITGALEDLEKIERYIIGETE